VQRTRVNFMIRITPVRLIGAQGEQVGVVETAQALKMAQDAGLDLVEVVPEARPPVCKIMDYGKYKFELSQKARKDRAASKSTEMKEVRLGRSIKIGDHDVKIRIDQSRRFLMAGHKVMVTQRFKGREIAHRDLGLQKLRDVADALLDIAKVEQTPRWMGKQASIIMAPDRPKIEAIKRKLEKERAEKIARGEKVEDEPEPPELDDEPDDDDDDDDDAPEETGPAAGQSAQPARPAPSVGTGAGPAAGTNVGTNAGPAPATISGPRPAGGTPAGGGGGTTGGPARQSPLTPTPATIRGPRPAGG
jgi:translation initiation factor IF-3